MRLRVTAGSGRDEVGGLREGVVLVRVAAPALDGRANRAVCRLLARHLRVAPSRVTIARGERSREKLIEVEGVGQDELDRAFGLGP